MVQNRPASSPGKKQVLVNGIVVGEIETNGLFQDQLEKSEALIKSLGLWKEPSTELAMFNHASAFAHAGSQVYATLVGDPSQWARAAAPFVVLATFAIEIYLKALAKIHGISLKGHELLELFNALPPKPRSNLISEFPKYARARGLTARIDLVEELQQLNNAFVNWRYTYEKPSSGLFNIEETVAVMETLHKTIQPLLKSE